MEHRGSGRRLGGVLRPAPGTAAAGAQEPETPARVPAPLAGQWSRARMAETDTALGRRAGAPCWGVVSGPRPGGPIHWKGREPVPERGPVPQRMASTAMDTPIALTILTGVLLLGATASAAPPRVPVVVDTDIGTDLDDVFALALVLASPELDLRAVTTVSG